MIEKRIPVVREHDFPYQVTHYYCPYQCGTNFDCTRFSENPRAAYNRLKRHMQVCSLRPKSVIVQAAITEWAQNVE